MTWGGKELHDQALLYGDLRAVIFVLGVLAPRDKGWLWGRIVAMCARGGTSIPGGDTAWGFANTTMQLAHQKLLPEVLAAVVWAMSAVWSLIAFEHGAVGPSKDYAYEGPILEVITGCPISMEGKSATCALQIPRKEQQWMDRIEMELERRPVTEDVLRGEICETYGNLFDPASYGWG
jgi:methanol--5-hydroxybenzimidazolylcobamide Co-methyltransferase